MTYQTIVHLLVFSALALVVAAAQVMAQAKTDPTQKVDASAEPAVPAPSDAAQSQAPNATAETDTGESSESEPGFLSRTLGGIFNSGPIKMIRDGGWFMPPILILGVLAAGVIIERYRSLRMLGTDTTALRATVQELLQQDRIEEALELCDREQGSVPAILSCGLRKFYVLSRLSYDPAKIDEQVVKSMDDYSVHIVAQLERHLPILATIASVAPMLGFLGTVSGMINSFQDIVDKIGEVNIVVAAADGISEALLTTCFGLIVGIPAFIAYNYFTSLINSFVLEVEESATELIDNVTMQMALSGADER
jgi:biopolymer transport protein ExbB